MLDSRVLAIDEIVQQAHDCDPKRPMVTDLRPAIEALFDELEAKKVEYLLVGGIALLSYVEGRNTQDIDLIVGSADIGRIDWNAKVQDRDFAHASYRGVRVDLLLRDNPVFDDVAARERAKTTFHRHTIPVVTREGLLLLKLYALPDLYRHGQLGRAALYEADIRMLHQGAAVDDDALLGRLAPHLAGNDIAELARILREQRDTRRF
jgi:hypothetical protein